MRSLFTALLCFLFAGTAMAQSSGQSLAGGSVGAGHIDSITEIDSALRTGIDLKLVTGTEGGAGFCAEWNSDGDLVEAASAAACGSGGTTVINALGDANNPGAVQVGTNAEYGQVWTWNWPLAEVANLDALTLRLEHDSTSGAFVQRGLVIIRPNTAGTQDLEAGMLISNSDTDAPMLAGFQVSAGTDNMVVSAFEASDAEITNALSIGQNDVLIDGNALLYTEFEQLLTIGATTISAPQWQALGGEAELIITPFPTIVSDVSIVIQLDENNDGTESFVINDGDDDPVFIFQEDGVILHGATIDDDVCDTAGEWWYDTLDTAFEFCEASSGTPIVLGGSTAWDDIGDADGYGTVGMASWDQALAWDTSDTTAVAFDGLTFSLDYDPASADGGEQNLVRIVQKDSGGDAVGTPDALLLIENVDTTADDAVAAALEIRATTAMPIAIDVSDATIATALAIGLNKITSTNCTLGDDGANMDFTCPVTATSFTTDPSDTGALTITTDTLGAQVSMEITEAAGPDGIMDLKVDEAGALVIYIQLDGANETVEITQPLVLDNGTSSGQLQILEPSGGGTEKATFVVPALTADTDYTLPPNDGDAGQILQTDGSGVLTWEAAGAGDITDVFDCASGNCDTIIVESGDTLEPAAGGHISATNTVLFINNNSGSTLFACTAVYVGPFDGPSGLATAEIADADDSGKMPVIGLVENDIANGADGSIVTAGHIETFDTVTGEVWTVGDFLYVNDSGTSANADCGNTLTNTRPADVDDAVQFVAQVARINAATGELIIFGANRVNDVPNLEDAKIWVGNGSNLAVAVSMSGDATLANDGTLTIDAEAPVATSTGGALTINTITLATAVADYDLPDNCDSATGAWVTLIVQDVSEVASLTVTDVNDRIVYKGLSLGTDDELDSPGAAQDSVTVVCLATGLWYVTANSGDWEDGGVAD